MATKEELEKSLTEAKELITELDDKLRQLLDPPRAIATVVGPVDEPGFLSVIMGGNILVVKCPKDYTPRAGDQVLLCARTQGVDRIIQQATPGKTVQFKRYIDDTLCEITSGAQQDDRLVFYDARLHMEEHDQVLLDSTGNIVLRNLGKPLMAGFKPSADALITWEDVGGLDEVREFFHEVFEAPFSHPEIYSYYGMKPPKGVLMTGPPGCGKSLIAKAVAHSMTSRFEGDPQGGFISVKGPEILSPWVGMAEMKIRELFDNARAFNERTGFPAVIFIDEAESVMSKRGSTRSSDVDKTIVPAFLAEMDGLNKTGAIVILATNRPEMLDSAIVREGRIDKKVRIPRPSLEAGKKIFRIHLRHVPLSQALTHAEAAEHAANYFYSAKHVLYYIIRKSTTEPVPFTLGDLASGAMIATVCQQASGRAMSRDIRSGQKSGVGPNDIEATILEMLAQTKILDHKEEVADHVQGWRNDVDRVVKAESVQ